MSAAARKMMEKMGWKEGEGLGKDRDGVKSYLRVVRRDAHTATGLGHMADPAQGGSLASTHAVELDGVFSSLAAARARKARRHRAASDSEADDASTSSSSSSSSSPAPTTKRARRERERVDASTSSSSSSSSASSSSPDSDHEDARAAPAKGGADVTRMSDADLFARCGGVRLGRAGRHRFFDGKLSRIDSSNASPPSSPNTPHENSSQGRKKAP